MKIALDIRRAFSPLGSGVEGHCYQLLMHLMALDKENLYLLYGEHMDRAKEALKGSSFMPVETFFPKALPEFIWEQGILPLALSKAKPDLVHSMEYILPLLWKGKSIVTIHDLAHEVFPEDFPPLTRLKLQRFTLLSCRKATRVIAVSEHTKKDLVELYKIHPEKIRVIYNGKNPWARPIEDKEALKDARRKYGLNSPFILYLGDLRAKKNLVRLMRAFELLKKQEKVEHLLVIVGKKVFGGREVDHYIMSNGLSGSVKALGYVPEQDVALLMNCATALVYPSLYEGFGLPVLEAMACGTPVLTSDLTSMPEVAGDAALYCDPLDIEEMAEKILTIINDESLAKRLREKGLERARLFSWEEAARQTLSLYKDVLEER